MMLKAALAGIALVLAIAGTVTNEMIVVDHTTATYHIGIFR